MRLPQGKRPFGRLDYSAGSTNRPERAPLGGWPVCRKIRIARHLPGHSFSVVPITLSDAAAWKAVQTRDGGYDSLFVYAVSSTRIYCRPSCSSRRPTRSAVHFFDTPAAAE